MLSKRLTEIADMIEKDMIVADIGCDHAFLPVHLIRNSISDKVYAIDNKKGPLQQAINTIEQYQLQNYIIPLLQDGILQLPDDVTCVVIAGMGADLIVQILKQDTERIEQLRTIIVQPNNSPEKVRQFISDMGYTILDESMVFDYKYYPIIKFNAIKSNIEYTENDILFGPKLKQKKSDTWVQYMKERYQKLKDIQQKYPGKKEDPELIELEKMIHQL